MISSDKNPQWWTNEHTSTWDRVKAAFKRDWEQTKADFSSSAGRDIGQDAGDTVKQAAGKQTIPPLSQRNPDDSKRAWDQDEPALRYGYGAQHHYQSSHADWDDRLESKLKEEWNDLKSGRTWDEVKSSVRRGWDNARQKLS